MTIGERIRIQRRRSNIKQEKLSDCLGVSVKTIQRWEADERSPKSSMLPKLAEALNTSVEYLMGLNDDATPPPSVKQELPINNMKEKENDDLDLGYWGAVVERAERAARSNDNGKKALIAGMLRMATDAITGSEGKPITEKHGANIFQTADGVRGNVKQTISTVT